MLQIITSTIVFILLACPCFALQVTFKQQAEVNGSVVTLSDIAQFDEKSEMAQALGSQKIGQAPPPGESIVLRSLSIKQYLMSNLSLRKGTINWTGSPTVMLKRRGVPIGPTKIEKIISDYLIQHKADLPDADIRFIAAELPLPFILPVGKVSYEVIPSNPRILGSSKFSIIFRVDNRVAKNMSIKGAIEALAPIVVTTTRLKKGAVLSSGSMALAIRDLSKINSPGLDINAFLGKKLKRSLRAGSPILLSMIESRPVIKRGERVKIFINSGAMHLSTFGIARNDGRQDQMIRVQNISSKKIVYCRVAAPGLVEVTL